MSAPLSKLQKRYLSQLSDRTFNRQRALALGRGEEFPPSPLNGLRAEPRRETSSTLAGVRGETISETELLRRFRHAEVAKASGKLGLRCCSQDDYKTVEAHFLNLLNEPGRALAAHVHGASNGRRQVEWKITQSLARLGKGMAYAEGICRQMHHGTGLMDASEKQLWKIFYALEYQIKRQRAAGPETGAPHSHAA